MAWAQMQRQFFAHAIQQHKNSIDGIRGRGVRSRDEESGSPRSDGFREAAIRPTGPGRAGDTTATGDAGSLPPDHFSSAGSCQSCWGNLSRKTANTSMLRLGFRRGSCDNYSREHLPSREMRTTKLSSLFLFSLTTNPVNTVCSWFPSHSVLSPNSPLESRLMHPYDRRGGNWS